MRSRPRVRVIAPNVVEAVNWIGGWVFDHAIAGWDVCVLVDHAEVHRALRILGASSSSLDDGLKTEPFVEATWAVASSCYFGDVRVRRLVTAVLSDPQSRVVLWGFDSTDKRIASGTVFEHQLSSAARAFKVHALAAVDSSGSAVEQTEPLVHLIPATGRRTDHSECVSLDGFEAR